MRKAQTIFTLAIFAIALFSGLASAAISVTGTTTNLAQEGGFVELTISSNENETVTLSIENIKDSNMNYVEFSIPTTLTLDDSNNRSEKVNLTYTVQSGFNFELTKKYSTTLNISGSESGSSTRPVTMAEDFCEGTKNIVNLEFLIDDINVESGFGDDDDFWYLMDEISVEFIIDNPRYDIDGVKLEWELYTTAGKKVDSGKESVSDIDYRDDETVFVNFRLDKNIKYFDGEDAILYARVIGAVDDRDSSLNNEKTCAWTSKQVDVEVDDDFVIVTDVKFNQNKVEYYYEASCGEEITLTGDVWNIGADRQKDFYIEVYSNSLNIHEKFEFSRLDAFSSDDFSLTFKIPEDAIEGNSKLTIEVFDKDDDLYENNEDDLSFKTFQVRIPTSCKVLPPRVTAELSGEAMSGENIVIKSIITNENDKDVAYTITAKGYESWAKLVEIKPQVVTLSAGESKVVEIVLNANSNTIGEKTFEIQTISNGEVLLTQPILVNVEKGQFDVRNYFTKENLQIAGIVLLNLILLVAIIIVARKIIKRK